MEKSNYIFTKGKVINCTLKTEEINPRQINYTWFLCKSETCDEKSLNLSSESASLRLKSQSKLRMKYLCKVENAAGSDTKVIDVIKLQTVSKCNSSNNIYYFSDIMQTSCCMFFYVVKRPSKINADTSEDI